MATTDEIKDLMKGLSKAQLADVRSYATLLISMGGNIGDAPTVAKAEDMETVILGIIASVCADRGADFTSPMQLAKVNQYKSFREKVTENDLTAYYKGAGSRIALRALIRTSIELLYDSLVEMSIPVSSRALMNHVHRVPSVMNDAFPGYYAAGMLHLVIRTEDKPNVRQKRKSRS